MKHLVGTVQSKKVPFMGDEVEIRKLSISQVMDVQKILNSKNKDKDEMHLLRSVLRQSVVGAEEMTDLEFNGFPPGDLNVLSEMIMEYCGLGEKGKEAGN